MPPARLSPLPGLPGRRAARQGGLTFQFRRNDVARDVILNLAVSLDGFICDEDGGFDWIGGQGDDRADTAARFDSDAFLTSCDTVVMGRRAYEDCGIGHISGAAGKQFLVAAHTPRPPEGNVRFLSKDVAAEVMALKNQPGGQIWLFGGGELASDLIRADAVDRFIVGILPVIRGGGRRLFREDLPPLELRLDRCTVTDGMPILEYSRRKNEEDAEPPRSP